MQMGEMLFMNAFESIIQFAEDLTPAMVRQRRDFHKYAESGWMEMRTSSIIARRLTEFGYEVLVGEQVCHRESRMGVPSDEVLEQAYQRAIEQGADPEFVQATRGGMTGVIGILRCGEGPTIAMRFDIDALGVNESQEADHFPMQEGFTSLNAGVMHACGHDGHATSGLGVAEVLMQLKDQLHGTVKLIFQPSEEGVRGAKSIVENGHLDDVDYFLSAHTSPMAEDGFDIVPGSQGSLATYKYDVVIKGKASHAGSRPQDGKNALLAASTAVLNMYAIPRHSKGATRVNVGKLIAGSGRNVIADEAFMEIELRGISTELNEYMDTYAKRILENAAAMHDCTVEYKLMGSADSIVCDMPLVERVAKVCKEDLGLKVSDQLLSKVGGSEDVSYMMSRVRSHGGQATFMRIRSPQVGGSHNRKYNFDESYLPKAVKIFCAMAYDLMK